MKNETACDTRLGSPGMQGEAEREKRRGPFFAWSSLGLSVASLIVAAGIFATRPHDNLVAAYGGLLLCGLVSVFGLLAGIIGLHYRENPKHAALAGIAFAAVPVALNVLGTVSFLSSVVGWGEG